MLFNPKSIQDYLCHKLGEKIEVLDLTSFTRGTSRETRFLTFRKVTSGETVEVVIRSDRPAGSGDPTPLDQEYFIYERLGHTDVPAARVLWWEDDPQWTDRPFYTREKIEGSWNIPNFYNTAPEYDEYRINIAKNHLRKLAIVHHVNWQELGFDKYLAIPRNEEDAPHTYVESILKLYRNIAQEPLPIVFEMAEWLHDHAIPAPRLCLCKGTNGLGEEVFRDGELVAFSDWEEASIGDPAADFAFMQDFLFDLSRDGKPLWNLELAVAFYREVSRINITVEAVRYYQAMRILRLLVLAHNSGAAAGREGETFIRQIWTGTEVLHISKHILASAMGIYPPVDPEWFAELNQSVEQL